MTNLTPDAFPRQAEPQTSPPKDIPRLGNRQHYLLEWLTNEYCDPADYTFYARDRRILRTLQARGLVTLDPGHFFEPAYWYITDAGKQALADAGKGGAE